MIPFRLIAIAAAFVVTFSAGFGAGFRWEKGSWDAEKVKQSNAIAAYQKEAQDKLYQQNAKSKSETDTLRSSYETAISQVTKYYANRRGTNSLRQSGTTIGTTVLPNISSASNRVDDATSYDVLAGQCAESTTQLISIQKWIRKQETLMNSY